MLNKPLHKDLTLEVIEDGVRRTMFGLDNVGFCTLCGVEAGCCEPDAENYECESCGAPAVFGAEELLLHLVA